MATLVGCSYSGALFKIDTNNGSGTLIGSIGYALPNSLARDSSGSLYSVASGQLIKIDPDNGTGALVVKLQGPADVRALAFSSNDVLYGIVNGGGPGEVSVPDDLVTINLTSGVVTVVGNTGRARIQGLAFASNGTLYGWDLSYGLLTINPTSGVATLVNPAVVPGSVVDLQSIAFAPDGRLFGAREKLYTVAVGNGSSTLVGSGGYQDLRGLEFLKEDSGGSFRVPPILRYGWVWMFLIGYILVTPIGPLCIACGDPLGSLTVRLLGAITLVVAGLGLATRLSPGRR